MAHLVSRADLARMLGISRAAVTKRCAKSWAEACTGDRVDTDHPAIQEAGAARGAKLPKPARAPTKVVKAVASAPAEPTAPVKKFKSRGPKPTREQPEDLPDQPEDEGSLEDLADLGLLVQPLLDRFKSAAAAREWAKFQSILETTAGRKLANAQARGEVIPREFVRSNVIGLIDGVTSRLLSDTPKTLCRQLYSLARSGAPVEDAEKMIRQLLGKQLAGLKARAEKALLHGIDSGNRGRPSLARGADRVDHDRADADDAVGMG